MSNSAEYFTSRVVIEKVLSRNSIGTSSSRRKGEVTSIVVRASTIEKLKEKLSAHIDLIDDDAIDTGDEGTTR